MFYVYSSFFSSSNGAKERGKETNAVNKSAFKSMEKVPPQASVKLCTMERPKPLPSVVREASARTKRSTISLGSKSSSCRDMLFIQTQAFSSCFATSIYTREFSKEYCRAFTIRFWKIRYSFSPSATIISGVSQILVLKVRVLSCIRSSISAKVW